MRWRWAVFATITCVLATGLLPAHPPGGLFGFGGSRGRVVIVGGYGGGYFSSPTIIPASGWIYPYGIVERRVTIEVVAPPVQPRWLSVPPVDVSGIDLDVHLPPWADQFERLRYEAPKKLPPRADVPPIEPIKQPPAKVLPPKADPPKAKPPEVDAPKADPVEESRRLTLLGLAAFRGREYGLAARRFAQAIDLDPTASRSYFFLGQADFALGKYRDAVQTIGLGLGLEPAWPRFPFRPRFDLYLDHPQDWQQHLALLENTQAQHANDVGYAFLLAYQRWFDDQRDDAVKLFRQVRPLVADPSLVDLFLKKGP